MILRRSRNPINSIEFRSDKLREIDSKNKIMIKNLVKLRKLIKIESIDAIAFYHKHKESVADSMLIEVDSKKKEIQLNNAIDSSRNKLSNEVAAKDVIYSRENCKQLSNLIYLLNL
ncbi:21822_t:CDS:1 [Cetraspora pellucida]|uniref:21822_t:CDS:1 n=1 Tax=Cetraspora pellucida TaxID=1433469 RepID=A0A9N9NI47_9GLOM|nr:21822_t:CDS:1 [Cetraspora pellucida]